MKFLEQIKTKKQTQSKTHAQNYRRLIHKAAVSGDLSAGDTEAIEQAATALGIEYSKIEADVKVVRKVKQLQQIIDSEGDTYCKYQAAGNAVSEVIDAAEKSRLEWVEKIRIARGAQIDAEGRMNSAKQTERQLYDLQDANKELFDAIS